MSLMDVGTKLDMVLTLVMSLNMSIFSVASLSYIDPDLCSQSV